VRHGGAGTAPEALKGCFSLLDQPLSQIPVTLRQGGTPKRRSTTDEEGCFVLEDVVPGAELKISLKKD
jgi:hypothetical protein